jgi:hypothetical protein
VLHTPLLLFAMFFNGGGFPGFDDDDDGNPFAGRGGRRAQREPVDNESFYKELGVGKGCALLLCAE